MSARCSCGHFFKLCLDCGKIFCTKCSSDTSFDNFKCPDCESGSNQSLSDEAIRAKIKLGHAHW